jgi:hypothetical protein
MSHVFSKKMLLAGKERSSSFMHPGLVSINLERDAFHLSFEASYGKAC